MVHAGEMEKACNVVSEVVPRFSALTYSVGGLGCFPNQRRPRVLWVGVREQSGKLAALYNGLEQGFAANGFASENRDFHPHLTLGRVRREARQADQRALSEVLARVEHFALGEYHVKEICVFHSDLRPSGAVYTKLLSAPLGEAA